KPPRLSSATSPTSTIRGGIMIVRSLLVLGMLLAALACYPTAEIIETATADGPSVTFTQSVDKVDAYDFVEVTAALKGPTAKNPFTDVSISGQFAPEGGKPTAVEGFCDSSDGSTYRIRFMPSKSGKHSYSVTVRQGDFSKTHSRTFEATD